MACVDQWVIDSNTFRVPIPREYFWEYPVLPPQWHPPVLPNYNYCPQCGIKLNEPMGYVCGNYNCPIQPKVTCELK